MPVGLIGNDDGSIAGAEARCEELENRVNEEFFCLVESNEM
jgi:hypothetical protein